MTEFRYLDKSRFSELAPRLFDIMADNMASFDHSDLSRQEEFCRWREAVGVGLRAENRQILMMLESGRLVGYLQYYTNATTFMIEELQLIPERQGRVNCLWKLAGFLIPRLPPELETVEAFVHTTNARSLSLQRKLGMEPVGTAQNGRLYHMRGSFPAFACRFSSRK